MKNKSWIIILIMGIALTISLSYSIIISQKVNNKGESTVTTRSIIEMTATTVTIKNTLIGSGTIEAKEKKIEKTEENIIENSSKEDIDNSNENREIKKSFQIMLSIDDKDFDKAKIGQSVEISIKKQEEILNCLGSIININKESNNKSTITVEIVNPNDQIEEGLIANCTIIVEKAENVVALPIEAIQKNENQEEFVDVVQIDGSTKPVIIQTGISDDYYVEITSGLMVGDRVQIIKSSITVVEENKDIINEK